MNGHRRRGVRECDDIAVTIVIEINDRGVECLLRRFVINRRVKAAGPIAGYGDKALRYPARRNSRNDIGKTVTVNTASGQLLWHRNKGVEQDDLGRAKRTVSIV